VPIPWGERAYGAGWRGGCRETCHSYPLLPKYLGILWSIYENLEKNYFLDFLVVRKARNLETVGMGNREACAERCNFP